MPEPTKVLVFTGAGAGVPLGLPTSTGFGNEVTGSGVAITQCATEFLTGVSAVSAKDIEWILATLASFQGERAFIEHVLPRVVSGMPQSVVQALPPIQQKLGGFKTEARNEIKRIKKLIFEKLGRYDHEKARTLYPGLLAELKDYYPNPAVSMITTNYDLTFENTLVEQGKEAWKSYGIRDVDFGFSIEFGRAVYDPARDFAWKPEILEFLKVHGSLDWHRDERDQCCRSGSKTVPDNPDEMAILYPGFKGVPEGEPFASLHRRLIMRLSQADVVFVLGFAFRDAYINNIFENALRTRQALQVYYFNPLSIEEHPERESMAPRFTREFPNFRHLEKAVEATDTPLGLGLVLPTKGATTSAHTGTA